MVTMATDSIPTHRILSILHPTAIHTNRTLWAPRVVVVVAVRETTTRTTTAGIETRKGKARKGKARKGKARNSKTKKIETRTTARLKIHVRKGKISHL